MHLKTSIGSRVLSFQMQAFAQKQNTA